MNDSPFTIYHARRRHSGFTLIEMLVVLLILGLVVALAGAIVRPDPRHLLRVEAERLAQLLDLAATESQVTGKSIGWIADGAGYRFVRRVESAAWSEIRDSDLLRPRALPQGVGITLLQIESLRPQDNMRLEFTPYGSPLAFTIEMSSGAERYAVLGSPLGDVRAASFSVNGKQ